MESQVHQQPQESWTPPTDKVSMTTSDPTSPPWNGTRSVDTALTGEDSVYALPDSLETKPHHPETRTTKDSAGPPTKAGPAKDRSSLAEADSGLSRSETDQSRSSAQPEKEEAEDNSAQPQHPETHTAKDAAGPPSKEGPAEDKPSLAEAADEGVNSSETDQSKSLIQIGEEEGEDDSTKPHSPGPQTTKETAGTPSKEGPAETIPEVAASRFNHSEPDQSRSSIQPEEKEEEEENLTKPHPPGPQTTKDSAGTPSKEDSAETKSEASLDLNHSETDQSSSSNQPRGEEDSPENLSCIKPVASPNRGAACDDGGGTSESRESLTAQVREGTSREGSGSERVETGMLGSTNGKDASDSARDLKLAEGGGQKVESAAKTASGEGSHGDDQVVSHGDGTLSDEVVSHGDEVVSLVSDKVVSFGDELVSDKVVSLGDELVSDEVVSPDEAVSDVVSQGDKAVSVCDEEVSDEMVSHEDEAISFGNETVSDKAASHNDEVASHGDEPVSDEVVSPDNELVSDKVASLGEEVVSLDDEADSDQVVSLSDDVISLDEEAVSDDLVSQEDEAASHRCTPAEAETSPAELEDSSGKNQPEKVTSEAEDGDENMPATPCADNSQSDGAKSRSVVAENSDHVISSKHKGGDDEEENNSGRDEKNDGDAKTTVSVSDLRNDEQICEPAQSINTDAQPSSRAGSVDDLSRGPSPKRPQSSDVSSGPSPKGPQPSDKHRSDNIFEKFSLFGDHTQSDVMRPSVSKDARQVEEKEDDGDKTPLSEPLGDPEDEEVASEKPDQTSVGGPARGGESEAPSGQKSSGGPEEGEDISQASIEVPSSQSSSPREDQVSEEEEDDDNPASEDDEHDTDCSKEHTMKDISDDDDEEADRKDVNLETQAGTSSNDTPEGDCADTPEPREEKVDERNDDESSEKLDDRNDDDASDFEVGDDRDKGDNIEEVSHTGKEAENPAQSQHDASMKNVKAGSEPSKSDDGLTVDEKDSGSGVGSLENSSQRTDVAEGNTTDAVSESHTEAEKDDVKNAEVVSSVVKNTNTVNLSEQISRDSYDDKSSSQNQQRDGFPETVTQASSTDASIENNDEKYEEDDDVGNGDDDDDDNRNGKFRKEESLFNIEDESVGEEDNTSVKEDNEDNTSVKEDNTSVKEDNEDNTSVKEDNTSVKEDNEDNTSVKEDNEDNTSVKGDGSLKKKHSDDASKESEDGKQENKTVRPSEDEDDPITPQFQLARTKTVRTYGRKSESGSLTPLRTASPGIPGEPAAESESAPTDLIPGETAAGSESAPTDPIPGETAAGSGSTPTDPIPGETAAGSGSAPTDLKDFDSGEESSASEASPIIESASSKSDEGSDSGEKLSGIVGETLPPNEHELVQDSPPPPTPPRSKPSIVSRITKALSSVPREPERKKTGKSFVLKLKPLAASESMVRVGGGEARQGGETMFKTPTHTCDLCGKTFTLPGRLQRHKRHHLAGKHFYCDVCGKSFVDQEKLDFHHKVHTQSADGDFRCDQCGHVCRNWRSFVYHTQTHSGDVGKKHSCERCGHTLSSLQRLQRHRGNHRRGLHFCCFGCGKLFRTEVDLARHAVKHSKSPPPPLVHPHPAPAGVTPLPAASPTTITVQPGSRQRPEDPSLTRSSVVLARATQKRVNEAEELAESSSPVPQQTPTLSSEKGGDGELLKDLGSVKEGDLGSPKEDRGLSQDLGSLRETVAEPSALGRKVPTALKPLSEGTGKLRKSSRKRSHSHKKCSCCATSPTPVTPPSGARGHSRTSKEVSGAKRLRGGGKMESPGGSVERRKKSATGDGGEGGFQKKKHVQSHGGARFEGKKMEETGDGEGSFWREKKKFASDGDSSFEEMRKRKKKVKNISSDDDDSSFEKKWKFSRDNDSSFEKKRKMSSGDNSSFEKKRKMSSDDESDSEKKREMSSDDNSSFEKKRKMSGNGSSFEKKRKMSSDDESDSEKKKKESITSDSDSDCGWRGKRKISSKKRKAHLGEGSGKKRKRVSGSIEEVVRRLKERDPEIMTESSDDEAYNNNKTGSVRSDVEAKKKKTTTTERVTLRECVIKLERSSSASLQKVTPQPSPQPSPKASSPIKSPKTGREKDQEPEPACLDPSSPAVAKSGKKADKKRDKLKKHAPDLHAERRISIHRTASEKMLPANLARERSRKAGRGKAAEDKAAKDKAKVAKSAEKKVSETKASSEPGTSRYPCSICGKTFSDQNTMKIHFSKHLNKPSPKQPEDIESVVKSCQLASERGSPKREGFMCHRCGFKAQGYADLTKHMWLHSPKPHQCPECGLAFAAAPTLQAHMKCHRKKAQSRQTADQAEGKQ